MQNAEIMLTVCRYESTMTTSIQKLLPRPYLGDAVVNELSCSSHTVVYIKTPNLSQQFPDVAVSKPDRARIVRQRNNIYG